MQMATAVEAREEREKERDREKIGRRNRKIERRLEDWKNRDAGLLAKDLKQSNLNSQ